MQKKITNLPRLQAYMRQMCRQRGWQDDEYTLKMTLLLEELGELAKAMRRRNGVYEADGAAPPQAEELADEFADVLSYLLELANMFSVDLATAFWHKELKNASRVWRCNRSSDSAAGNDGGSR